MTDVRTVHVATGPGYDVRIGSGVLAEAAAASPGRRTAVIADTTVANLHGPVVLDAFASAGRDAVLIPVAPGEPSKDLATYGALLRRLASDRFGRDDAVLALGGGVVCDLAGFVAATWMRGVPLVHAPTTLLAMADAAIGGKTGVNLPEGKNLVGAFWRPAAVLMDVRTLATLPAAQIVEGCAEVLKHGLLADPELSDAIASGRIAADAPEDDLIRWVAASASVKAGVVAGDEREAGERAHLNLGHTLAHTLEAASGHRLAHGAAVAWGLLYAAILSRAVAERCGWPYRDWSAPVRAFLTARPVPYPPEPAWEQLEPYLARDKKARGGTRRWVLMDGPCAPYLADDVPPDVERDAWARFRATVAEVRRALGTNGGDT